MKAKNNRRMILNKLIIWLINKSMKRTKERFGKLESYNKEGISGLKVFDGEDLEYQDRVKLQ